MKQFRFHAQQGQASIVCRLLTANVSKPKVSSTDKGVLIVCDVPVGMSKRSIDRMLFANNVPGASPRRNRFPVIAGEEWELVYNDKAREGVFHWVYRGKFQGKHEVYYHDFGCDCCGGYFKLRQVT
jgi:hypothetical protein